MINFKPDTAIVAPPVGRRRRWRVLLAALLAVLGAGAVYRGHRSSLASAAPRPALPPPAQPPIEQSVQPHHANADVDVGPGEVEPIPVGAP